MPLTPLDIHNKEFSRRFRGYDEDEVNEFLDQVVKDYEMVLRDKRNLEEQVRQLQERLDHFKSIEDNLNKSLVIAQETAEELKQNAQKEAKLIIREAEKNADRIINEALSKARRIAMEIEDLKKQSKVFRNRLRTLIEAQLDLIDSEDWDRIMEYDRDATEFVGLNKEDSALHGG